MSSLPILSSQEAVHFPPDTNRPKTNIIVNTKPDQTRPSCRKSHLGHSRSGHYNLSSSQLLPIPHDSRNTIKLILPSLAPQQPVPVVRVSISGRLELAQDAFDFAELFRGEVDVDGLDVLDGTFGRA
jgi:hypothetical protein